VIRTEEQPASANAVGRFELRLLGGWRFLAPDGAAIQLATRKSAALLAFLALQPGMRASRERLAALLWDDVEPPQALRSLRQAVSIIRKASRPELLVTEGAGLALAPELLQTDVAAFEAAVAEGQLRNAAELYVGDLLADFAPKDAPGFDDFALLEQQRLRTLALAAMEALLAEASDGRGEEAALRDALRLLAIDPFHEKAHRLVMRVHHQQGRPAAALRHYQQFAARLQRELDVRPEAETEALARQISDRGRRARDAATIEADPRLAEPLAAEPVVRTAVRRRARRGLVLVVTAAIATAAGLGYWAARHSMLAPGAERRIAVLPVQAEGQANAEFVDGLTQELIDTLGQETSLRVTAAESAFAAPGDDPVRAARRLAVDVLLRARVAGADRALAVELLDGRDGRRLWAKRYAHAAFGTPGLESRVGRDVAAALGARRTAVRPVGFSSAEAHRLYLIARAHERHGGREHMTAARLIYDRLMTMEPQNPRPYAGYALTTIDLTHNYLALDFATSRRLAEAAIAEALRLDPKCVEAYVARGVLNRVLAFRVSQEQYLPRSVADFRRALALAPQDPDALRGYGTALLEKQPADAVPVLQRALDLDPLSRGAQIRLALAYEAAGRWDEARRRFEQISAFYPDAPVPPQQIGLILIQQGRLAQAEPWLRKAVAVDQDAYSILLLGQVYANLHLEAEFARTLDALSATPTGAQLAASVRQARRRDYCGLMRVNEAKAEATQDAMWRHAAVMSALMCRDLPVLRRNLAAVNPRLLSARPSELGSVEPQMLLAAAYLAQRSGDEGRSRALARKLLDAAAPRPGHARTYEDRGLQALALAQLGEPAQALAALQEAFKAGFRTPVGEDGVDAFDAPMLDELRRQAGFQKFLAELAADNERARLRLVQVQARGEVAPS